MALERKTQREQNLVGDKACGQEGSLTPSPVTCTETEVRGQHCQVWDKLCPLQGAFHTRAQAPVLAAPLPTQSPANVPGKTAEDGPRGRAGWSSRLQPGSVGHSGHVGECTNEQNLAKKQTNVRRDKDRNK